MDSNWITLIIVLLILIVIFGAFRQGRIKEYKPFQFSGASSSGRGSSSSGHDGHDGHDGHGEHGGPSVSGAPSGRGVVSTMGAPSGFSRPSGYAAPSGFSGRVGRGAPIGFSQPTERGVSRGELQREATQSRTRATRESRIRTHDGRPNYLIPYYSLWSWDWPEWLTWRYWWIPPPNPCLDYADSQCYRAPDYQYCFDRAYNNCIYPLPPYYP